MNSLRASLAQVVRRPLASLAQVVRSPVAPVVRRPVGSGGTSPLYMPEVTGTHLTSLASASVAQGVLGDLTVPPARSGDKVRNLMIAIGAAMGVVLWGNNPPSCEESKQDTKPLALELFQSVMMNDEKEVKSLLKGVSPGDRVSLLRLSRVLFSSAYEGNIEMMRFLLEGLTKDDTKKLMNEVTKDGQSVFPWAVRGGDKEVIEVCLTEYGADVNCGFLLVENSPLELAIAEGNVAVINLLLKKGADVHVGEVLNAVIVNTTMREHERNTLCFKLIARGAPIKSNTLSLAIQYGSGSLIAKIIHLSFLKEIPVDTINSEGKTPLNIAIEKGLSWAEPEHSWVVASLLRAGADVNKTDGDDWTPLMTAARDGSEEVVNMLVRAGADVNQKDEVGWTALMLAARDGSEGVVKMLVAAGADVDQKDEEDRTPLMLAMTKERTEMVDVLLRAGADVNQKEEGGHPPLLVAVIMGNIEMIKVLLRHGADVKGASECGNTPLKSAVANGNPKVVSVLLDSVDNIFEKVVLVNQEDKDGRSPLMIAIEKGSLQIAKYLVEAGANVNAVVKGDGSSSYEGYTPLMFAIKNGDDPIANFLLLSQAMVTDRERDFSKECLSYSEKKLDQDGSDEKSLLKHLIRRIINNRLKRVNRRESIASISVGALN